MEDLRGSSRAHCDHYKGVEAKEGIDQFVCVMYDSGTNYSS